MDLALQQTTGEKCGLAVAAVCDRRFPIHSNSALMGALLQKIFEKVPWA